MNRIFSTLILLFFVLIVKGSAQEQLCVDSMNIVLSHAIVPEDQIPILLQLSDCFENDQPDKAIEYANLALQKSTNTSQKLEASIRLAEMYNNQIEYELAMELTLKSIDYAKELGDMKSLAGAYRILGLIYMYIGEYEESSENLFYSLKMYEEASYKRGMAKVLSNIGTLYFVNENYKKSLEYVVKSIAISKEIQDTIGISSNLNNLATCYASMGMFDNVEKYIREAITLNKRSGLNVQVGINYQNLGEVFNEKQMYDSALCYFEKALSIYTEEGSYTYMPIVYIDFSEYYKNTGNKEMQTEYAKKAYELAIKYKLKKSKIVSAGLLYDIYFSQKDFEKACRFGTIQYQLKDSLRLMESMTKLSQLEFQYQSDKIEQDRKNRQQKRDIIIMFVVIILILSFLVLLLLFARQKIKVKNSHLEQQRLQDEVEFKNKELTTNVMGLIKKNEILAEISEKLIQITHKTIQKEAKNEIYKLSREIEQTMDTKIWEEFEKRFSLVHNKFYSKLADKYPNLTPNELKLCAFLRLNLTSKDVSELTGQQLSAIEVARYRLRKKLNISNTQVNLVTFLSQI
jgi:tetratricopeptide (TPR) repeat protein